MSGLATSRTARGLPRAGGTGALAAGLLVLGIPGSLAAQDAPAAPINLEADVNENRVRLTWDVDEDAEEPEPDHFHVYRNGVQIEDDEDDEQYMDREVEVGVEYTYEVSGVRERLFFPDVEGPKSEPLTVTIPDDSPPDEPDDLEAVAVSASQIDLEWDESEDDDSEVVGYYVYRDGASTPHDSTGDTRYSDIGLAAYTEYTYRVSALNVSGAESEQSDPASARTFDDSPPTTPANLAASEVSANTATLVWDAADDPESGISRYLVFRDGGSDPIDDATGTTYTDEGLSSFTEYDYEVAAVNGAGLVGPRSSALTVRTLDSTPPGAPPNVAAEATGARLIELSWNAASDPETDIVMYLVYRDGSGAPMDSTPSPGFTDGTVEPETSYSYRVTARNGSGLEGPPGGPAEATTPAVSDDSPPSVPGDFSVIAPQPRRVEVAWSASEDPESGIAHYRVYRDGEMLGTSPGGGFTDLTVEAETTYEYRVSAVNGDGLEGPSTDPASVTTPDTEDTVPPAPPTDLRVVTE